MQPKDKSELMIEIIIDFKREHKNKETREMLYRNTLNYFKYNNWSFSDDCLKLDDAFDEVLNECVKGYSDDKITQ